MKQAQLCKAVFDNKNCERDKHANGYCGLHAGQFKRRGRIVSLHPDPMRAIAHLPAVERFALRIQQGGVNGHCWEWQGAKHKEGYASFSDGGKKWRGHRWAWENIGHQTLTPSIEIDHICNFVSCVRPSHLQALSSGQHHQITSERKAILKERGPETWEWVAGNPKPLSMREVMFAMTNNLPANILGWNPEG
jgi:hypothetical protein